ncbi:MAG: tetratricopeptide repeat protein [Thermoplasmatota archaeon]
MLPSRERKLTKYIGRRNELSLLNDMLEEVKDGRGKLVIVGGEAGIGKTRLIGEMKELPNFNDFRFLSGRCLYFKDTDIYLPFKEMYTQYRKMIKVQGEDVDSPFSQRRLLSQRKRTRETQRNRRGGEEEQEFVPMSLIPAEIDVDEEEEESEDDEDDEMVVEGLLEFDKLSQFIFNLAEEGPLCLFIDDLHWADPPSIKLLQFLAHKIVDERIMIICTYRPEDLFYGDDETHPLAEPLKRLARDKLYVPIDLERFSREETDTLIKNILNIDKVPKSFSDMIFKRTNGNPFFVEEVLYSLMERGVIDPTEPDWADSIDPDTISLPTTLKDVILRRIHWLKNHSLSVIRLASVCGPRISYDVIRESLDIDDEEILEALEELIQAKFLKELPDDDTYEFENPVIQEVIYSELNHSRRRFLHMKMGKVLEEKFGKTPSQWGIIGLHYYRGKDFDRSLRYLTKAASHYQQRSPRKALEYLHIVLDCIERVPQSDSIKEQNMEVLLEISNLCMKIGDWDRSLEFSERSKNLATVLRRPLEIARAKVNLAEVHRNRGDFNKAMVGYEEIVNSPKDRNFSEVIALSYMGIGYIDWRKGDYSRALEMYSKALQYGKIANNLDTIGKLYINIGNVFNHRGDSKKAVDYYQRGIKHLENNNNYLEASRGYSNLGNVQIQLGDYEKAEESLETSIAKAKEKGRYDYWWPSINKIQLLGLTGRSEEAERVFDSIIDHVKERDDKVGLAIAHLYLGNIKSLTNRFDEGETLLVRSISILESLGVTYDLARGKLFLGEHYIRTGNFEEGKNYLQEAYDLSKGIGARSLSEISRKRLLELRKDNGFL